MNILITGGAGFIGSHIAEAYRAEGHDVFVIDNLSTGDIKNLPSDVEFSEMDIRSPNMEHYLRHNKIDVVNHHAANVSVRKSVKEPINDAKINIAGTLNLLYACAKSSTKAGVRRIIFSSSAAVYGAQEAFPVSEIHTALPISPYGASKLACEHYLFVYKKMGKINFISLRYGVVYGPRQNQYGESGIVHIIFNSFLKGQKILVNGDGEQTRDFVYVDDIVIANILALRHGGGIINIGTGVETSINELFLKIKAIISDESLNNIEVINLPKARGEPYRMVLNRRRAYHTLGWIPKVELSGGLDYYYKFLKGGEAYGLSFAEEEDESEA